MIMKKGSSKGKRKSKDEEKFGEVEERWVKR